MDAAFRCIQEGSHRRGLMGHRNLIQRCRARGISIVYVAIVIIVLFAMASLGVDLGRVQLAKTELRQAADAAARAGAAGMNTSIDQANTDACAVAAANNADGASVTLVAKEDIKFGTWDPDACTFTVLTGSAQSTANAIRVTARRTSARGNAVQLFLAKLIGRSSIDISASATATAAGSGDYGLIGLKYIKMGGNTSDSYYSPDG